MFRKLYTAIVGDPSAKAVKRYQPIVEEINALEKRFEAMHDEELRAMTREFQVRIQSSTEELREQLAIAEQEYLAVLGTDEQKFARVEVDRVKKEILAVEEDELER